MPVYNKLQQPIYLWYQENYLFSFKLIFNFCTLSVFRHQVVERFQIYFTYFSKLKIHTEVSSFSLVIVCHALCMLKRLQPYSSTFTLMLWPVSNSFIFLLKTQSGDAMDTTKHRAEFISQADTTLNYYTIFGLALCAYQFEDLIDVRVYCKCFCGHWR